METIRIRGIKRIILPASVKAAVEASGVKIKGHSKRKRKKIPRNSKFTEKLVRRSARAQRSVFEQYLSRHNRSNRKKRNGWMKDWSKNIARATRKGGKRFKLSTLF